MFVGNHKSSPRICADLAIFIDDAGKSPLLSGCRVFPPAIDVPLVESDALLASIGSAARVSSAVYDAPQSVLLGTNDRCSCSISDDGMTTVAFNNQESPAHLWFSNPKQQLHTLQGVGTVVATQRQRWWWKTSRALFGRCSTRGHPNYWTQVSFAAAGIPTTLVRLHCRMDAGARDGATARPSKSVAAGINRRVHDVFWKGTRGLSRRHQTVFELHVVEERTEAMRIAFGLPKAAAARRDVV